MAAGEDICIGVCVIEWLHGMMVNFLCYGGALRITGSLWGESPVAGGMIIS